MKAAIALIAVILIAGCTQVQQKELCKEIGKARPSCECLSTNQLPESMKGNQSVAPECFCMCFDNGTQFNFSVVSAK